MSKYQEKHCFLFKTVIPLLAWFILGNVEGFVLGVFLFGVWSLICRSIKKGLLDDRST